MPRDGARIRDEPAPEWWTIANGIRIRRMVEGNGCSIVLYRLDSGRRFDQHEHPFAEFVVVLAGSGRALVGEEDRALQAGDSIFVPGGTPHGFEVDSGSEVVLMDVAVPALPDLTESPTVELIRSAVETARTSPRARLSARGSS